jgi:MFS family permease
MTRARALALVSLAELLAMSLWFGASVVAPALAVEWRLGSATTAWLTLAVQLGFVAGTLVSAVANLPDVVSVRRLFAVSAFAGAAANALFAAVAHGPSTAIALRFLTGVCLAGVYPPGMKIIATWFREGRGFALGVLVGALTLGKASPYLINALGSRNWRIDLLLMSALAALGGVIVLLFVDDGPYALPNQPFDLGQAADIIRNRGVRLANFGYFGHMWELYAMWTWAPVMLRASMAASGAPARLAEAGSFLMIGSGAVGCIAAGRLADRIGRAEVASAAMIASGTCCVLIGFLFGGPPAALLALAAIWGATVVADSAQFSALVTELADPRYIGTALTLQTCIGFLITTASIRLMPVVEGVVGWRWAFAVLAPGPILGTMAMLRLRRRVRPCGAGGGGGAAAPAGAPAAPPPGGGGPSPPRPPRAATPPPLHCCWLSHENTACGAAAPGGRFRDLPPRGEDPLHADRVDRRRDLLLLDLRPGCGSLHRLSDFVIPAGADGGTAVQVGEGEVRFAVAAVHRSDDREEGRVVADRDQPSVARQPSLREGGSGEEGDLAHQRVFHYGLIGYIPAIQMM